MLSKMTCYEGDADKLLSDGTQSYSYDQNGNLLGAGTSVFTWDYANRLASATTGGPTASYAYDGDGTRTSKTVNGTTTGYLWDRQADLPLLASDGTSSYLSDTSGSLLGQLDASSTPTYYLDDGLGSVRGTTQAAGTLSGSADYDVFGAARSTSGTQGGVGYAGEQTDAETGFSYLRSREYNPLVGRFLSADSVQPNAPGTQGYDLYAYVANNPTTWADPSGHGVPLSDILSLGVAAAFWAACGSTPWCAGLLAQVETIGDTALAFAAAGQVDLASLSVIAFVASFTYVALACFIDVTAGPDWHNNCFHPATAADRPLEPSTGPESGPPQEPIPPVPPRSYRCDGWTPGPYAGITSPPPGQGPDFSRGQKDKIVAENKAKHGGQLTSDLSGVPLVPSVQDTKGSRNPPNAAQIDHICPKDKGGDNSYANACVLSFAENNAKRTNGPYVCPFQPLQPRLFP